MSGFNQPNLKLISVGMIFGLATVFLKGTVVMLGVIAITGIILWNFLPKPDKKFLVTLFIAGVSLRIILFATIYIVSVLQGGNGELVPDSRLYFLKTLGMIKLWEGQPQFSEQVDAGAGNNGYIIILAFFYKLIGFDSVIINPISIFSDKLINCLIGTISGIPIFYIAKDIFGRNVAKIASFLVMFYPSLVLWSMTNNREMSNIFLVCLILLCLLRSFKGRRAFNFIAIFISLLCLATIRGYILFCMIGVISISYLFFILYKSKNKFRIVLSIVIACLIFLNFTGYGKKIKSNFLDLNNFALSVQATNTAVLSQGGSTYRIYDDDLVSGGKVNKAKLINGFLKGWFYFMLVPFPWAVSSKLQILSYPQAIIWYFLLFSAIIGIIIAVRYRFKLSFVILSYIFIVTSGFALSEGNVGSTLRHRDLITPFYFIFASVGLMHLFKPGGLFEEEQ